MDHEIKFYFFHMISMIHNSEEKSIFRRISISARTFTGEEAGLSSSGTTRHHHEELEHPGGGVARAGLHGWLPVVGSACPCLLLKNMRKIA